MYRLNYYIGELTSNFSKVSIKATNETGDWAAYDGKVTKDGNAILTFSFLEYRLGAIRVTDIDEQMDLTNARQDIRDLDYNTRAAFAYAAVALLLLDARPVIPSITLDFRKSAIDTLGGFLLINWKGFDPIEVTRILNNSRAMEANNFDKEIRLSYTPDTSVGRATFKERFMHNDFYANQAMEDDMAKLLAYCNGLYNSKNGYGVVKHLLGLIDLLQTESRVSVIYDTAGAGDDEHNIKEVKPVKEVAPDPGYLARLT